MKKKLSVLVIVLMLVVPFSAQASIFDDLVGVVKDLQKQVVDLVSIRIDLGFGSAPKQPSVEQDWNLYTDALRGFSVEYPRDWSTTTIFSVVPRYGDAVAFVRNSRADFLSKIIRPDSSATVDLAVQDSAIFFGLAEADGLASDLNKNAARISTSTKQVGSSTALYILHSSETDPTKYAGGSTEKYVFSNGSTTVIAEASYSSDAPSGISKAVFDRMLLSFHLSDVMLPVSTTTAAGTSTPVVTATSTGATTTSQTAGSILAR